MHATVGEAAAATTARSVVQLAATDEAFSGPFLAGREAATNVAAIIKQLFEVLVDAVAHIAAWNERYGGQAPEPGHRPETKRSCVAAEILMLTYLPPATCGVVCTSMILPLKDPGSAAPAICRHTAIGMITDTIL